MPVPDGYLKYPVKEGPYPDGSFDSDRHLKIEFCCRQDGFVDNGIHLPLGKARLIFRLLQRKDKVQRNRSLINIIKFHTSHSDFCELEKITLNFY